MCTHHMHPKIPFILIIRSVCRIYAEKGPLTTKTSGKALARAGLIPVSVSVRAYCVLTTSVTCPRSCQ